MSGDYRKFGKHGPRKSRITFAGNGGGDGDHLNINSAGILQPDDRSKSMDSMAFDDPSLNLTDDDTFANVLDVTTASESEDHLLMSTSNKIGGTSDSEPILDNSEMSGRVRSADLRIQLDDLVDYSEDISKTTDSNAFVPNPSKSYGSGSAHQDETESLTEFEEIERLIKANTAQDSDDDFSDIPEDLEKKIISGRISRGSNNSRQNSGLQSRPSDADVPLHSSRSSKSSSSSSSSKQSKHSSGGRASADRRSSNEAEAPCNNQTLHQDTGYGSEAHESSSSDENNSTEMQTFGVTENFHSTMISTQDELNERVHSPPTNEFNVSQPDVLETLEETASTGEGVNMDRYIVPTHRSAVGDTNEPDSLVATFGTTENFEVLLQQQLDDMNEEDGGTATKDYNDRETEPVSQMKQNGNLPWKSEMSKRQETRPPNESQESARRTSVTRISPRNRRTADKPVAKSRLKLSDTRKAKSPTRELNSSRDIPGTSSGRNTSRSTRSPAANRAKKASNKTNGRETRLTRQSSDDMSIKSDVSKTELRSKLKEEAQTRKRDEEFVKQLQENYGELLMKYAEAENTIDHLRLGAKINIFATVPRVEPELPTLPYEEAQLHHTNHQPRQATVPDGALTSPLHSPVMFASDEGPSKLHASSVGSDKDSWVESSLQLPAAASAEFLRVALQLQAKDLQDKIDSFQTLLKETDLTPSEQNQAMDNIEDSLHALEHDYLAAVDQHVAEQRKIAIATGGNLDGIQPFDPDREMESDIFRLGQMVGDLKHQLSRNPSPMHQHEPSPQTSYNHPSSPEVDVEEQFDKLMKKYNRAAVTEEDHTAAPNINYSSHDEMDDGRGRPTSKTEHIANRYFQPSSNELDESNVTQTTEPPSLPQSPLPKMPISKDSSRSPSPSKSRLPRPVSRSRRSSSVDHSNKQADKGTDSGFVGSESSRQSAATAPLTPVKTKLVTRPPAVQEVQRVPDVSPPVPSDRRNRHLSCDTTSTMQTNERPRPKPMHRLHSYHDKVPMYKPPESYIDDSMDDISTTTTVREMLKPRHRSRTRSISSNPSHSPAKIKSPLAPFPRGSRSGASVKSKDSSKSRRSMASSTRDSTLDAIRGDISKLRDEMKALNHGKENVHPVYTSTPRVPLVAERSCSPVVTSDNEALRAIHDDIQALKDEVQRQGKHKIAPDTASVKSADASSTNRRSRSERKTPRSRRSQSLDRGDLSDASTSREESPKSRRGRSRSQTRNPFQGGYWTYIAPATPVAHVPPVAQMVQTAPPVARVYTRPQSPVQAVYTPAPIVYPMQQPPQQVVYMEQPASPARVYVPTASRQARIYTTPSKPNASIFISPRQSDSGRGVRKASVYIVDSDNDEPLRRSHLSSRRRSSSMSKLHRESPFVAFPDSRLNDSIERAERASERLRSHSRTMYRTVRDDLYRAQLLADTM